MNLTYLDWNELIMRVAIKVNSHISTAYIQVGEERIEAFIHNFFNLLCGIVKRIKLERPPIRAIIFM